MPYCEQMSHDGVDFLNKDFSASRRRRLVVSTAMAIQRKNVLFCAFYWKSYQKVHNNVHTFPYYPPAMTLVVSVCDTLAYFLCFFNYLNKVLLAIRILLARIWIDHFYNHQFNLITTYFMLLLLLLLYAQHQTTRI